MKIGDALKKRRLYLGLTLEDVGNAVGVGKSTVKKWESGLISNMRRDRINELAKILRVSPLTNFVLQRNLVTPLSHPTFIPLN